MTWIYFTKFCFTAQENSDVETNFDDLIENSENVKSLKNLENVKNSENSENKVGDAENKDEDSDDSETLKKLAAGNGISDGSPFEKRFVNF